MNHRYTKNDIILEVSELCYCILAEIEQHLTYYRASVYKEESHRNISHRTEKLRVLAKAMGDEGGLEIFRDYDAMKELNPLSLLPGECVFSTRTKYLCLHLQKHLQELEAKAQLRQLDHLSNDLALDMSRHRRELLLIVRPGSRHWAFFSSL
jgi:hypothetical protein